MWVRSGISSPGGCERWLHPLGLKHECSTFKPILSWLGETHRLGFQQHGGWVFFRCEEESHRDSVNAGKGCPTPTTFLTIDTWTMFPRLREEAA